MTNRQPWKPRKKEDKTFKKKGTKRGILVGPGGGTLKKSIARSSLSASKTVIGIKGTKPLKYASVHNFGLRSGRKSAPFMMPQRKFMGESKVLSKKISRLIGVSVGKIL